MPVIVIMTASKAHSISSVTIPDFQVRHLYLSWKPMPELSLAKQAEVD
jgi:hypothetical protein